MCSLGFVLGPSFKLRPLGVWLGGFSRGVALRDMFGSTDHCHAWGLHFGVSASAASRGRGVWGALTSGHSRYWQWPTLLSPVTGLAFLYR